jgi:curved DNA-binding protein CbpA
MGHRDHYAMLGLPRGAELSLIQTTYWRLARQCNSALTSDPEAPRLLRDLNVAYEVLSTPQLRRQYDELLARAGVATEASSRPRWRLLGRSRPPPGNGKETPQAGKAGRETEPASPPAPGHLETSRRGEAFGSPPDAEATRDQSHDVREALVGPQTGAGVTSPIRWGMPALRALRLFSWRLGRLPRRLAPRAEDPYRPDDGQRAAALRDSTAAIVARWRQSTALSNGQSWPPAAPGAPPADS